MRSGLPAAKEIEELFRIIRQLKADGCGIVYISHRLEELKAIVDRVTIMRDGQYITDGNFKDMTMDQIIANMVHKVSSKYRFTFALPASRYLRILFLFHRITIS